MITIKEFQRKASTRLIKRFIKAYNQSVEEVAFGFEGSKPYTIESLYDQYIKEGSSMADGTPVSPKEFITFAQECWI